MTTTNGVEKSRKWKATVLICCHLDFNLTDVESLKYL